MASGGPPATRIKIAGLLDICDRIVGESGSRDHVFSWLRDPDDGAWLKVDAYYRTARLVIDVRARPAPADVLRDELVPAHGMRLLAITPDELAGAGDDLEARLRDLIEAVVPRPTAPAPPPLPAAPRAQRAARPRPAQARAQSPSLPLQAVGIAFGLVLIAVPLLEGYGAVVAVQQNFAGVVLALALVADAGARTLGAVAASDAGEHGWAWGCLLAGSVAVLPYTSDRADERGQEVAFRVARACAPSALALAAFDIVLRLFG